MELTQADIIAVQELQYAVNEMAAVFTRTGANGSGKYLTCAELDALAKVLRNGGYSVLANSFVQSHADTDEEDDLHHGLDLQVQIREYVASL